MATTKALELAQLSTNLSVDENGNVTSINIDSSQVTESNTALFFTDERVDDRVSNLLVAGDNVTLTYDDANNTLTIAATEDNLSNNTTDDLAEGNTALYYTDARVQAVLDGSPTLANDATVSGDLLVSGNFTVSGNTTFVNSDNLEIEDLNIVLASGAANSAIADGAGITIDGADATITYNASMDAIAINKKLSLDTDFNLYVNESGHKVIETDQDSGLIAAKGKYFFVTGTTGGNARTSLSATLGGSVNLRYDDTTRFETTATGADVTGTLLADNIKSFGNANSVTVNTTTVNATTVNATTVNADLNGSVANTTLNYSTTTLTDGAGAQGNFYFDALNLKLKVHTGSTWVDAVPAGTGGGGDANTSTDAVSTFDKYTFTIASDGVGTISGADDANNTLTMVNTENENVEVFVNGIKLVEGVDYSTPTTTQISFTSNLNTGSVVDVQVYELLTQDAFYLKNEVYTKTETNSQITTALGSYIPYSDTSEARTFTIDATGTTGKDAVLVLKSDVPEVSESANGRIIFNQDGNLDLSAIGMNLNVTGRGGDSLGNDLIIANSISSGGGIRFATGNVNGYTNATTRLLIQPDGKVVIGEPGNLNDYDIPGTAHDDLIINGAGSFIRNGSGDMSYGFYDTVGTIPSARMLYNAGDRALDLFTSNATGTSEQTHLRIDSVGRLTSNIGATSFESQTSASQFTVIHNGNDDTQVTGSITGTTLTVTSTTKGGLAAGMFIWGGEIKPRTMVVTDNGGGSYTVNVPQEVASREIYARDYNTGSMSFTDTDTAVGSGQSFGNIIFKSWDVNGEGSTQPKAYIDVTGQDGSPDANMHFGTHRNSATGIAADKRMTVYYDGQVHVGDSMTKRPYGKLTVQGTDYDTFFATNTAPLYYQYASSEAGLAVVGTEAGIDIVGEDNGDHASSILLRNQNEGFGFVNDPNDNRLRLKSFTADTGNFYIHAGGSGVSELTDIISFTKAGAVNVHNKLVANQIIIDSDFTSSDNAPTRLDLCNDANEDPSVRINFFEGSYTDTYQNANMFINYDGGTNDPDGSDGHMTIGGYNSAMAAWSPNVANQDYLYITRAGNVYPAQNGLQDLGGANNRWANVYTSDLHLSNEAKGPNDIDGTTGNWTVVEGEEELYIKNNKTGKKYAFMLREID